MPLVTQHNDINLKRMDNLLHKRSIRIQKSNKTKTINKILLLQNQNETNVALSTHKSQKDSRLDIENQSCTPLFSIL